MQYLITAKYISKSYPGLWLNVSEFGYFQHVLKWSIYKEQTLLENKTKTILEDMVSLSLF